MWDKSVLDSALAKPRNVFADSEVSGLFRPGCLVRVWDRPDHAFIDGNKRTALVISILFLDKNGWDIEALKTGEYLTFLHLADGSLNEDELTAWFTSRGVPRLKAKS